MKVVATGDLSAPHTIPEAARNAEAMGYDVFSTSETKHNPFIPLTLAAEHTERVGLQTSIALAFPRSPTDMAYIAWDLQNLSNGRLRLGLGSQVRGHIVRRFSGTWSSPAARMREYILAMRAAWDCWQNGGKFEFVGKHYQMNLMPPFFRPEPIEHPDIEVFIAAVNSRMLEVAGELCQGVFLHSYSTHKYTSEVVLPSLERGAAKAGRSLSDIEVSAGGFVVTAASEEALEKERAGAKTSIAFYASTRSYAPVMATHGWDDTAKKLYRMSVEGRWGEMGAEITDEMLDAFAVVGLYDEIVDKIKEQYGPYAGSINLSIPVETEEDRELLASMIRELQAV